MQQNASEWRASQCVIRLRNSPRHTDSPKSTTSRPQLKALTETPHSAPRHLGAGQGSRSNGSPSRARTSRCRLRKEKGRDAGLTHPRGRSRCYPVLWWGIRADSSALQSMSNQLALVHGSLVGEHPVHGGAADVERSGDIGDTAAGRGEFAGPRTPDVEAQA